MLFGSQEHYRRTANAFAPAACRCYAPHMGLAIVVLLSLVALAVLVVGIARLFRSNDAANAVLDRVTDSKPAELQAANQAESEARQHASEVIRASDPAVTARIAELRARGRAGK